MKTITINKKHIRQLITSFVLSAVLMFVFEHSGHFNYYASTYSYGRYVQPTASTPLSVRFTTFLNNEMSIEGNYVWADKYYASDAPSYRPRVLNSYSFEVRAYFRAIFIDYKYLIIFTLGIFIIFLFFNRYKFKIS